MKAQTLYLEAGSSVWWSDYARLCFGITSLLTKSDSACNLFNSAQIR